MPVRRAALAAALVAPVTLALPAAAAVVPDPVRWSAPDARVSVDPIGSYDTGIFDKSAAEIVEYHAASKRLFVVNAAQAKVEVLDASNPAAPRKLFDITTPGAVANSVAVRPDGLGVIAVEASDKTEPGQLVFFDATGTGTPLGSVQVGSLPDMVTITPDGSRAVVANEGEPADDYSSDPEGSISVVSLPSTVAATPQSSVRTADFHAFEGGRLPAGVRVFGGRADAGTGTPAHPVSGNLEPEYVAVDQQSKRAFVTLQEANAIAVVDLRAAKVDRIFPLGTVDRTKVPFDASDKDGITIRTWPVQSMRQPDSIASYQVRGKTYLVTADEGDTRAWTGYDEEVRVKDLGKNGVKDVCPSVAAQAGMSVADLKKDANLGRLEVTKANGLDAAGTCYQTLYAFGGRGFSVWSEDGSLVWSSGDQLERTTAAALPTWFNSDHAAAKLDDRSDDKGPEPEGVAIGKVAGRTYAFLGLERVGGVITYDVTDPAAPRFVGWTDNRHFADNSGDLGPEGLAFISEDESPTGVPLLAVGNEVSGSTTLFGVQRRNR